MNMLINPEFDECIKQYEATANEELKSRVLEAKLEAEQLLGITVDNDVYQYVLGYSIRKITCNPACFTTQLDYLSLLLPSELKDFHIRTMVNRSSLENWERMKKDV